MGWGMRHRLTSFDVQAETYDQRVGLSERDCEAIVRVVLALTEAKPGDLLLEVGAGTGMLGAWLARPPLRYVGLDFSRRMLAMFQRRLMAKPDTLLLQADGNAPWPLAASIVRVIFGARALHWLDPAHVVRESIRVAHPDGAVCIVGRVQRQADSVPAMLQRELQRVLRQYGFHGREGIQHQRELLAAYGDHGATVLDPVVVLRWTVTRTLWQSIEDWQSKPGLGGVDPSPGVKHEILHYLCGWAEATCGDLHQAARFEEAYVLQAVR